MEFRKNRSMISIVTLAALSLAATTTTATPSSFVPVVGTGTSNAAATTTAAPFPFQTAAAVRRSSHPHRLHAPPFVPPLGLDRLRRSAATGDDLSGSRSVDDMDEDEASRYVLELLDGESSGSDSEDLRRAITKLEAKSGGGGGERGDNDNDDDAGAEDPARFEPLLGLYEVKSVVKAAGNEGDNPVGGKWTRKGGMAQRVFRTRRMFQHLLPFNSTGLSSPSPPAVAEAVNVVSIESFGGLARITVLLRGDAIPLTAEERRNMTSSAQEKGMGDAVGELSDLAVRANFDPPRVILGKRGRILNLSVGPRTSVVLDAPHVDGRLRIGKGGTSGTRFVFARCGADDGEAEEFRALLDRRPARRIRVMGVLAAVAAGGAHLLAGRGLGVGVGGGKSALFLRGVAARTMGGTVSVVACLLALAVTFSGGGIERGAQSRTDAAGRA